MPPVYSNLINANNKIATAFYWLEQFLIISFWVAIFLGLFRIVVLAVMAIWQRFRLSRIIAFPVLNKNYPLVSIIVPAYNEEITAVRTIGNLLKQDYPMFEIIFVDDGSKDDTYEKVLEAFKGNSKLVIVTKINEGKASALNFGIAHSKSEFVVCIDADTHLKQNAISELMNCFTPVDVSSKKVMEIGAVAGNVKVGNEKNMLTRWQSIEYATAQNFDRRAFDLVNGITVVPGAIGAFRKEAIHKAGGFTTDTLAEDCDLTIRILRNGYRIINCPAAVAITEAPETLGQFMKQRFRWCYGIMQSFWKNRDACFNPKYKGLGLIALPNMLIFQIILPFFAPLADLMLILGMFWNRHNPASLQKIGMYYLLFLVVDMLVGALAFWFEKEKFSKLLWIIPQRLVYRQIMYVIFFKAIRKAIKGEGQGWGVLKRTGNVKDVVVVVQ